MGEEGYDAADMEVEADDDEGLKRRNDRRGRDGEWSRGYQIQSVSM